LGWIKNELAHADVPGEIADFYDPGQVIECLDSGMVKRVFLGGSKQSRGAPKYQQQFRWPSATCPGSCPG
jgi:hypothetical protein